MNAKGEAITTNCFSLVQTYLFHSKLRALINHFRYMVPGDLTSTRNVCEEKRQIPLLRDLNHGPLV